jgi:hypothetical protein
VSTTRVDHSEVWAGVLAALLAVALHAASLGHGYTFDDPHIIVENPLVTGDGGLWPILTSHYWAALAPNGSLYRPLTVATYWAQHRVAGSAPWSWHLVNILLHGGVTFVFYRLARRLLSAEGAVAAALLFAAHPVHTEAVVNVVGRAELLSAMGVMGAWLCRERLGLALPLFAGALLSKESAVALPGLLVVEDLVRRGAVRWRAILPFVFAVGGFVALRVLVVGPGLTTPEDPFVSTPAWHRVLTGLEVLGREAALMLVPWRLSADHSFNQIPVVTSPLQPTFLLGAAALAACAAAALLARRRQPGITLGIASFFVALLPVSNLLFGIGVIMAERLLYLPSAGACLAGGAALVALATRRWGPDAVAAGAAWWTPRRKAVAAITLIPVCVLSLRTAARVNDWFDQLTLFEATVRTSPRSALAHVNLATAYQALGRLPEAERHFRAAVGIAPARPGAHFNLGAVLEGQGRLAEAASAYREAMRLAPHDARSTASLHRVERLLASGEGGRGARPAL